LSESRTSLPNRARADKAAQELWLTKRLPAIRRAATRCRGVVVFEDEASFWQDGSLHRTWSRVGVQPRVDTYGARKTAHIFGAVALDTAKFTFRFADVFNGATFFEFLRQLVLRYDGRKVFLIIDNAPCHQLEEDGQRWLRENRHRIELHRLPAYSPESWRWKACGRRRASSRRTMRSSSLQTSAMPS
jgi:hypothetical protein